MISKGQIKIVHTAKEKLGLTTEEYREVLTLYGGVASSKDLTPAGFFNVMEHFRELGFMARGADIFPGAKNESKTGELVEMVTPAQRAKIRQLEADLGWADNPARLEGFIIKRFRISRVVTKAQASKLIEALKAILARQKEGETGT